MRKTEKYGCNFERILKYEKLVCFCTFCLQPTFENKEKKLIKNFEHFESFRGGMRGSILKNSW